MSHIILQNVNSSEVRAARTAIMLSNEHRATNCSLENLPTLRGELRLGAVPIGSVEFVRAAMEQVSIAEPPNLSYPPGCEPFLHRNVRLMPAGSIMGRWFVKPRTTKAFTGFVYDSEQSPAALDEHDRQQREMLLALPKDTPVFVCEPIQFQSEWRYYIQGRRIIGQARYDDEVDENAPAPQLDVVNACIQVLGIDHPYALDFGVLSNGRTALVEANDAWALGYYQGSMLPKRYLDLLIERWQIICNQRQTQQ
jgi:hypothetical protein